MTFLRPNGVVPIYVDLALFCTGEPVESVSSASSALVKTKRSRSACRVKLFTRLIKDSTRARKIKNPKLSNKLRSTTGIR